MILQSTLWCVDYNDVEVKTMTCDVETVKRVESEQSLKPWAMILVVHLSTT